MMVSICPMYNQEDETVLHLFFHCVLGTKNYGEMLSMGMARCTRGLPADIFQWKMAVGLA
ncbi:hypothetical protein FRX31_030881 [Thalictrum thalictroides]|uniref:Uncharacterized protein n=1 Tax=Thalictrum thalictroides TaxID=46969 RepID=A0A7J6V3R1_THATH|nr:hypothetical protein FRX31_030881 [Thalictrum thalictroides]